MCPVNKLVLVLFAFALTSSKLAVVYTVNDHTVSPSSANLVTIMARPVIQATTNGSTISQETPCDLTTNACMDWCGPTVRRTGYCPNNQMNNDKPESTYKTPSGLQSLFGEVEQVKSTMQVNMESINERGEKLQQLENTSREMMDDAQNLATSQQKTKKGKKTK